MNKRNTLVALFSFLSFFMFAQFEDVTLSMDGEWHLLKEDQGIAINYKFEVCDQFDRQVAKYILKIDNTNNVQKTIDFAMEMYVNGDCSNCDRIERDEYHSTFVLEPNGMIEGVCGENNKQLEYFSHYTVLVAGMSGKHLTDLKIVNLSVE